jgi:protein-tyrosine-phosphatase
MSQTLLLVIGAADTGRAPMTAAMLRRKLAPYGPLVAVESAGVLGHDDDPPTGEAIATMEQMGLDIAGHRARSLSTELVAAAALLIAVDSGTASVARARFPEAAARMQTLGELTGRQRDIPDPFKMQLGAWLTYARELDRLLTAALPRIHQELPAPPTTEEQPVAPFEPGAAAVAPERVEAARRIEQLIRVAAGMPGVMDWAAARQQIEADLGRIGALPAGPADMAPAFSGLLRAALALTPAPPTPGKLAALAEAAALLAAPVSQEALAAFSARLGGWAGL